MAKVKKASLSNALVSAGMGVVGGMAANLVDTKLMSTSSVYTKAGVKAAVGVALPMVLGGSITESLGASMVGVAGYQLAEELLGESTGDNSGTKDDTAGAAGLGLTPSYASAAMNGAKNEWIKSHTKAAVTGTQENNISTAKM